MKESYTKIDVPQAITIGALAEHLNQAYPSIFTRPEELVFAVNRNYATSDQIVSDKDEIAIIPPVSGGAS
jgi:molybdopterin converting factor subunit 1